MAKYFFNAPEHHTLEVVHEGDEHTSSYKGGSEVELSEEQHAGIGEPRLVPADLVGFHGVPTPVDQAEPDADQIQRTAVQGQPAGIPASDEGDDEQDR